MNPSPGHRSVSGKGTLGISIREQLGKISLAHQRRRNGVCRRLSDVVLCRSYKHEKCLVFEDRPVIVTPYLLYLRSGRSRPALLLKKLFAVRLLSRL